MQPANLSVCLEFLSSDNGENRFVRCVAVARFGPGLGLDAHGEPLWQAPSSTMAFAMMVDDEQELQLVRFEGSPEATLERAGRVLQVGVDHQVRLIQGDLLTVAGRTLRVHIHGVSDAVAPPEVVPAEEHRRIRAEVKVQQLARLSEEEQAPIEVRMAPPAPMPSPESRMRFYEEERRPVRRRRWLLFLAAILLALSAAAVLLARARGFF